MQEAWSCWVSSPNPTSITTAALVKSLDHQAVAMTLTLTLTLTLALTLALTLILISHPWKLRVNSSTLHPSTCRRKSNLSRSLSLPCSSTPAPRQLRPPSSFLPPLILRQSLLCSFQSMLLSATTTIYLTLALALFVVGYWVGASPVRGRLLGGCLPCHHTRALPDSNASSQITES